MPNTCSALVEQSARIPATGDGVDAFHGVLDRMLDAAIAAGHPVPTADAVALRTAVGEIVANIVEHACVGLTGAEVSLAFARFADRVEATFEDPGVPFVPPEAAPPDELPQGGIGLSVVRASVDEVQYTRAEKTNQWRIVRRLHWERP